MIPPKQIPQLAIGILLLLVSCRKEAIPPDIKEEPKFFTEAKLNGSTYLFHAGKANYQVFPEAGTWDFIAFRIPGFACTFTDQTDSFQVVLIGNQLASPHDVAREQFLNAALALGTFRYEDLWTIPSVNIGLKRLGKRYFTTSRQDPASHFNIIRVEDYIPAGAPHAMKKVEVHFQCILENELDPNDQIRIEDGVAVLLFTYEE